MENELSAYGPQRDASIENERKSVCANTMASQLNYTSDNSEFSDLPPAESQLAPTHRDESDSDDLSFTSNEDERAARVAPAPVTEDEKKVARAAAALKKAQQDAAQSEHCVFGAKAAHLELARVHAKKIRTAELAVQRLRAAKRSASTGGAAAPARAECQSPKAAAAPRAAKALASKPSTARVPKSHKAKKTPAAAE